MTVKVAYREISYIGEYRVKLTIMRYETLYPCRETA